MPLKGDLSTIGLADVFQMLSMSQKEGTLLVQDGKSRKCVSFHRQGISLLSSGQRKGLRIGEILVRHGKLTPADLESALKAQKSSGKLLGEVLVEQRYVTHDEIDRFMRAKVEDEICDLFTWRNATFEFIEGEPPAEFRDPMQNVTNITMDVNGLLLEALRRVDEWKIISEQIPNADVVFSLDALERTEILKTVSDDHKKLIVKEIDGIASVQEVADRLAFSVFDVCRVLMQLIQMKWLRRVPPAEMARRAKDFQEKGDQEKALVLVERASSLETNDLEIAVIHAEILKSVGKAPESAEKYAQAAGIARQGGDDRRAADLYRNALECEPSHTNSLSALVQLTASLGENAESCRLAKTLLADLWGKGDEESVKSVCSRAISLDAGDPIFPAVTAAVHGRHGEKREMEKQLKSCKRILAARPDDAKQMLNVLTTILNDRGEMARTLGESLAPKQRHPLRAAVVILIIVILAGVGVAVKLELENRDAVKERLDAAKKFVMIGDGKEGLALIAQAKDSSLKLFLNWEGIGEEAIAGVENAIRLRMEAEQARKKEPPPATPTRDREEIVSLISKAAGARSSGDLRQAQDFARKALQKASAHGLEDLRENARLIIDEADNYRNSAEEVFQRALRLEKEGKTAPAVQAMLELKHNYPLADQAKKVYFPMRIVTKPPGARIAVNNLETGSTPAIIRLSPDRQDSIKIEARGYESVSVVIEDKTVGEMFFELKKAYRWRAPVDAMARTPMTERDGTIHAAAGGKVYALRAEDGKLLWAYAAGSDVESEILAYGKTIVFGSNDGILIAVKEGKEVWRVKTEGMIRSGPTLLPDGATFVVGVGDGTLSAFDAREGKARWSVALPAPATGRMLAAGNAVYVGLTNGAFTAIDTGGSHRTHWSVETQGTVTGVLLSGDTVIFGATDRKVYAVSAAKGRRLWTCELGGEVTAAPAAAGNAIAVSCKDTFVYLLDREDGTVRKRFKTGGEIRVSPIYMKGKLLTGSDDGSMYCYEIGEGALLWRYDVGHPIRSCVPGGGPVVYIGTDGASVYAIDVD